MTDLDQTPLDRGHAASAISSAVVQLFREYLGKGPERAKTYLHDDLVVCLLRGGFNRSEGTLTDAGRADLVLKSRDALQGALEHDLRAAIERITGRTVVAFMSTTHVEPDLSLESFVLEPQNGAAG